MTCHTGASRSREYSAGQALAYQKAYTSQIHRTCSFAHVSFGAVSSRDAPALNCHLRICLTDPVLPKNATRGRTLRLLVAPMMATITSVPVMRSGVCLSRVASASI
ncbi:hypothetical protein KCP75_03595 [Salmonella enterica subsp. enterica]|nr:hypothetical protein KCP75_03595 [Salmonella enterica subsp. enterica]